MEQTNKFNLPQPVVAALTRDDYTRGESHISVTQLIDSPRVRILRAEFDHAISEDVSENLWSVLGRAAHSVMEDTAEGDRYIVEKRYSKVVRDWTLSGAIDLVELMVDQVTGVMEAKLWDYKVTSVWSVIFGKIDWERQLNVYAELFQHETGIPVVELEIVVICRDWTNSKARSDSDSYPQCPIVRYPIKSWDRHERVTYIEERMKLHQDAEYAHLIGDDLPHCTPDERWQKETKYAVKKKGRKSAIKVYDALEPAQEHADGQTGGFVETRPGGCTRCEQNWCRVASWCDQYQDEIEAKEITDGGS